jgi:site-specific DNA-methyltransferase (adenine-specific)
MPDLRSIGKALASGSRHGGERGKPRCDWTRTMLHLGDCLDPMSGLASLADASIDLCLTDPPFDTRTHRAACSLPDATGRRRSGPLPFPPLDPSRTAELAHEFVRVTKRWLIVFAAERQLETWASAIEAAGGRFVRLGTAVKANPAPRFLGDRPGVGVDHLVIAHAGEGRTSWNGHGRPAVWSSPPAMFDVPAGTARGRRQLHPTQKPIALMRALIEDFSAPGELVVDPFAGSGSTLVAALELGRRALGWEIDPAYHAIAADRIAAAVPGAPERVPRRRRAMVRAQPRAGEQLAFAITTDRDQVGGTTIDLVQVGGTPTGRRPSACVPVQEVQLRKANRSTDRDQVGGRSAATKGHDVAGAPAMDRALLKATP